jgi:2'-5' RNA ligase
MSVSASDEPQVRLFFAAGPDIEARQRIAAAAGALQLQPEARAVSPDNYHLTLAFVGAVPLTQVPILQQIGWAQRIPEFSVCFDAYEYWPKPQVIVAAAHEIPPSLEHLWLQLHRELAERQWALKPKRLRPHVTLARKVAQAPVLQAMSAFVWRVRAFSLMCSDTGGPQSVYTVVDTWPLLDETPKT